MSEANITAVNTALTTTANNIMSTFVELLPVIAVTVGIVFAINFIRGRFARLENI